MQVYQGIIIVGVTELQIHLWSTQPTYIISLILNVHKADYLCVHSVSRTFRSLKFSPHDSVVTLAVLSDVVVN